MHISSHNFLGVHADYINQDTHPYPRCKNSHTSWLYAPKLTTSRIYQRLPIKTSPTCNQAPHPMWSPNHTYMTLPLITCTNQPCLSLTNWSCFVRVRSSLMLLCALDSSYTVTNPSLSRFDDRILACSIAEYFFSLDAILSSHLWLILAAEMTGLEATGSHFPRF